MTKNFFHLIFFFRHHDILAKIRSRMKTISTFSRQNDAGLRKRTTYYWENFFLVVVLVLESKGLSSYFDFGGDRCFKTRVLRVSSPLML